MTIRLPFKRKAEPPKKKDAYPSAPAMRTPEYAKGGLI